MNKWIAWLLLTAAFAFSATGVVASAFLDESPSVGLRVMWLVVPVTALFMGTVLADIKYAVPRLLLRRKYFLFCAFTVLVSYGATLSALLLEYAARKIFDLPLRVSDYGSPWLYVDAFCNSMLLLLILLGIGAWQLYLKWRDEANAAQRLATRLDSYVTAVRDRLKPEFILDSLRSISDSLPISPTRAIERIHSLSGYLRTQLYELPVPPLSGGEMENRMDDTRITAFLVGRSYRNLRHVIFQIVLILISFETFFITPDHPDFSGRSGGFVSLFLFLNVLAYINMYLLFPRFMKRRSLVRYVLEICVVLILSVLPVIVIEIMTYDRNLYDKSLPVALMVFTTLGTLMTLFFFIGGTSALLLCQDWIRGQRRMMLLEAETARQEYAFLRKQINPHFLFNVLNNIGILSVDEPADASEMLAGLQKMIEYQFSQTGSSHTTLDREIEFLDSYLSLAQTRIEPFDFEISIDGNPVGVEIPTLMFIPFVENAVKYSSVIDGKRHVGLFFTVLSDSIEFRCENTYLTAASSGSVAGGLGIVNTRRRLELLYGEDYYYASRIRSCHYIANLVIPAHTPER